MPPLVSVIIPTWNRWEMLRLTIESVLAQTYAPVEIIVVDDGSTDATAEGLRAYGDRLRVIRQANQGGTAARNTGIQAAQGDYLTFLDHDDLMLPSKLERQVSLLQAKQDLGAAHCRWSYIDPEGKPLSKIGPLPEGDVYKTLVLGCFLWSGAPVVRRRWIEQVGGFDPAIWSSDWDLWLRLAAAGCRFGCVQQVLGAYRIMPDSTMADVERTERMDVRLLEKVVTDPATPPEITALRDEAVAIWRFWLARRYYATGSPLEGRRNLAQALHVYPALLADESVFLETLCNEALDVRVSQPFEFIGSVFTHLPPDAHRLGGQRAQAEAEVHIGLALRAYAHQQIEAAQSHVRVALRFEQTLNASFARQCAAAAMHLPVEPVAFVRQVLAHLPSEAASWQAEARRILSQVEVASAFECYGSGQNREAAHQMLKAVQRNPVHLRNRGVLSVLAKSLPAYLLGRG
jgi:hypothetical protein